MAALVLTLLAVGIHVIWAINDASAHPAFPSLQNPTTQDYYKALYYIPQTLGAWWLILLPIPIITITRNQASTITTAAALQIFFIDTLILNNSIIGNPLPILCLLATGGAAIFTTLMGRTTRPPRQWLVNLGMAVNLFLLVSMAHRLMRLCIHGEIYQSGLSDHSANVWMSPSVRPDGQGIPLTAGAVIMIIVATIASISLYLGFSSPTSRAFRYTVGVAPALMALVNMYILSVFGLSGAIVSSVLGLTSIGTGAHPHAEFRAWLASILLALLAIGLTVLMRRNSCVRQHTPDALEHITDLDHWVTQCRSRRSHVRRRCTDAPIGSDWYHSTRGIHAPIGSELLVTAHHVGTPLTWPRRLPMSPRSSPMRTRKIVSAALLVAALASAPPPAAPRMPTRTRWSRPPPRTAP